MKSQRLDIDSVIAERNSLLDAERNMTLGSDLVLSDNEIKANKIIMNLKYHDLRIDSETEDTKTFQFNASQHFFEYRDDVKYSQLFHLIQKMPKGAVLHAHDTGLLSPDYVLKLTYMDHLYVCFDQADVQFCFSSDVPSTPCPSRWQSMREARASSGDVLAFDEKLRKHFTIVTEKYREIYKDVDSVWIKFQQYFITTSSLICYMPVWEQYFYDTLKAFREDNVMYLEIRSVLPPLYDLDGNVYDSIETAKSYKRVLDRFMKTYPDFFGAKLIYAPFRRVSPKTVAEYIEIAKKIKAALPDFLVGFDLVGQEDLGVPIKEFYNELINNGCDELDFYFHAGETNQYGTSSDENLVDAIVMGTKRIGHGFSLIKHPLLMKEVKRRNIAIEVSVLSNHVLKLVDDVRNHPLAAYLAQDLPVVISSDDPGVWEAEPISHDFYVTFVGVASRNADLKLLKQLALNSLYYSSHSDKDQLVHEFMIRWTKFIDSIVRCSCCNSKK